MIYSISKDYDLFRKSQGISGVAMHDYTRMVNSAPQVPMNMLTPNIIEERQLNVASMDVFSRLMMDRIIFLGTPIDDTVSNIIVSQMLYLAMNNITSDIDMYINSPGGGVYAGLAIKDTMDYIDPKVNTTVIGMAASMGFILAINGSYRRALKNSRLMQHQPLGGSSGQASDIEIMNSEIQLIKKQLYQMISDKTGQPYEKVLKDCDRDCWMMADAAKEYGAIDEVINKK